MLYTYRMKKIKSMVLLITLAGLLMAGCKSSAKTKDDPSRMIRDLYAGVANVFLLTEDGSLWSAGHNLSGDQNSPGVNSSSDSEANPGIIQIMDASGAAFQGVKSIAAGEYHTLILKGDGSLWASGNSLYGELGLGGDGVGKLAAITQLKTQGTGGEAISGVQYVAAGNNSSFYIKDDGTLWAAGYNYYGELGLGDRENKTSFTQVSSAGNNVKAVSAGARHTVILKTDGTVWVTGYNFNGQLGLNNTNDINTFLQVQDMNAVSVAAGNYHTAVLKTDGTVWTTGENYYGQLGWDDLKDLKQFTQVQDDKGAAVNDAKEIAARGDLTLIRRDKDVLLLAGSYADPEPRDENKLPPENAQKDVKPTFASLTPNQADASAFKDIKKIILGYQSIYIVTGDSHLWAAGSNRYGQLNLGYDTSLSPVLRQVFP
jgi:alpha-tubulin suppressor-like RCC1 family protein